MFLETVKFPIARFKKRKLFREENVTQVSTEPESAVDALSGSSATVSNKHLTLPPSDYKIQTPTASGIFADAHDFVINNSTMVSVSNTFTTGGGAIMQLLETKTIQGAEHDSSARYPPPKCHPETRKSLKKRIFDWISDPKRNWRMIYVLGPAGVGKSAVAQTVADDCEEADCLGASCFISRPNHRNDPNGVIPTLAYQLAVKHEVYKRIISRTLAHDPTILRKTRRVQFKRLLIDPFHTIMTQDVSAIRKPLLIIIDGLDECEDQRAQCEFIELIGDHVRSFPQFPLLWLICSRPEWHLKYTLSQADFQITCRREEISVHGEEEQRDVLLYLQSEFRKVRLKHSGSLDCDWPPEFHLQQIATAASGLFAFASTIIRFVGDADAGDPSSQLRVFMKVLGGSNAPLGQNPYQDLDLLYRHILASIPSKILPATMRILGMAICYPHYGSGPSKAARDQGNFLQIGKAAFDHALKQLHSVLRIPSSFDAFENPIRFYHASFIDFLKDPERSGKYCLNKAAIHYDVALTALSWHMGLGHEIEKGDIWISPSENTQSCLENVKSQSLAVLWEACSRVEGENAIELYQKLQKFDFNVLDCDIPRKWKFGEFLSWLNLQERGPSTPKLLNSIHTSKDCDEVKVTSFVVSKESISGFNLVDFQVSSINHLDLGNGSKRRHMHITVIYESEFPEYRYLQLQNLRAREARLRRNSKETERT